MFPHRKKEASGKHRSVDNETPIARRPWGIQDLKKNNMGDPIAGIPNPPLGRCIVGRCEGALSLAPPSVCAAHARPQPTPQGREGGGAPLRPSEGEAGEAGR